MRRSCATFVIGLTCLACSEESSSSGWYYGKSDAGHATDASFADADAAAVDAPADVVGQDVIAEAGTDAGVAGPVLYPADQTHSPITAHVIDRMQEVLDRNPGSRRDVFSKVGDSITVSGAFLNCFGDGEAELGAHGSLQPTLSAYAGATVGATTPFDRASAAAESGRTAAWALSGTPSPLATELGAANPSVAVVMYGTNDIGWFGDDHLKTLGWYHGHLFDLADALLAAGVIPILSTIPPRDDSSSLDAWVPTFNAVIRGLAQGRQMPLVDFHRELLPLVDHGLANDGVHPNSFTSGGDACTLTAEGLGRGYNVRNWITLTALDRVRRSVIEKGGAIDPAAPVLSGKGTPVDPFVVAGNPFVDVRDTTVSASDGIDGYDCSAADESGPEVVYRLEVTEPSRVRAVVLDRGDVDVDIHLLGASVDGSGCVARGDTMVEQDLAPGTYHLVADTYVGGEAIGGEFLLVVLRCAPGDPDCVS